jgi:two-component system sensor histidine kinase UhpB
MTAVRDGDPGAVLSRLRSAALIPLGAIAVFLPVELVTSPAEARPALLAVYAVSALLAAGVLAAASRPAAADRADVLALALAIGLAVNTSLYLWVSPRYPILVSNALICLMTACALLFPWGVSRMAVVCGITCAAFAAVAFTPSVREALGAPPLLAVLGVGLGAASALAGAHALDRHRRRLARRQHELAALSARLMDAEEHARRALSRKLHEELGQSLTAVLSYLWLLERKLPADAGDLRSCASEARRLAAATMADIRRLSERLRPLALDDYGLVPLLEKCVRAFGDRHGIAPTLGTHGLPPRLPVEVETAVYRILQEALENVARHAGARCVHVDLAGRDGEIRLEVRDDGVGFPPLFGTNGIAGTGLIAVRERVTALGGRLELESDGGARLRVHLPLSAP